MIGSASLEETEQPLWPLAGMLLRSLQSCQVPHLTDRIEVLDGHYREGLYFDSKCSLCDYSIDSPMTISTWDVGMLAERFETFMKQWTKEGLMISLVFRECRRILVYSERQDATGYFHRF